jgi:hypothetical protein
MSPFHNDLLRNYTGFNTVNFNRVTAKTTTHYKFENVHVYDTFLRACPHSARVLRKLDLYPNVSIL